MGTTIRSNASIVDLFESGERCTVTIRDAATPFCEPHQDYAIAEYWPRVYRAIAEHLADNHVPFIAAEKLDDEERPEAAAIQCGGEYAGMLQLLLQTYSRNTPRRPARRSA